MNYLITIKYMQHYMCESSISSQLVQLHNLREFSLKLYSETLVAWKYP